MGCSSGALALGRSSGGGGGGGEGESGEGGGPESEVDGDPDGEKVEGVRPARDSWICSRFNVLLAASGGCGGGGESGGGGEGGGSGGFGGGGSLSSVEVFLQVGVFERRAVGALRPTGGSIWAWIPVFGGWLLQIHHSGAGAGTTRSLRRRFLAREVVGSCERCERRRGESGCSPGDHRRGGDFTDSSKGMEISGNVIQASGLDAGLRSGAGGGGESGGGQTPRSFRRHRFASPAEVGAGNTGGPLGDLGGGSWGSGGLFKFRMPSDPFNQMCSLVTSEVWWARPTRVDFSTAGLDRNKVYQAKAMSGEMIQAPKEVFVKRSPLVGDKKEEPTQGQAKESFGEDLKAICLAEVNAELEQKGSGPGARSSHAVALVGSKAYVFGGEFTPRVPVDNKLHVFDLDDLTWSVPDATGDVPPPRVGVTMAAVGNTIYVFGGRDADHKELNELYSFDTRLNEWLLLSPSAGEAAGPPNRSYHSMAADDRHIYVFGGCGVSGRLNDLWAYNVDEERSGNSWVKLPEPGKICLPRGGAGLCVTGGKVWVVYGFSGEELDDVHCFDPATGEWIIVLTAGEKPTARSVFSAAGIGKHVIVYGGEVDPSDLGHLGAGKFAGDAYALDTTTNVWRKLEEDSTSSSSAGEHPGPRGWCAFSGGRREGKEGLLVYGGNSPTNDRLDDIFFFTPFL